MVSGWSPKRSLVACEIATALSAVLFFAHAGFARSDLNGQTSAQDNSPVAPDNTSKSDQGETRDQKPIEAGKTRIQIHVTTKDDKPVREASVYVRFNESGGFLHHDKLAELDLKTNQDGTVRVPDIPQGKIMIQVIATGWHTFGQWYDIEKDQQLVEIKLDPPPHWY